MTQPTSREIAKIIDIQVAILRGHEVHADGLGPLAGLHVKDGQWRAEGTALVRQLLRRGLEFWATTSDAGSYRDGRTADSVRSALEAAWGISQPPLDFAEAGRLAEVDRKTVTEWSARVTGSPRLAEWLEDQPFVEEQEELPSEGRPQRLVNWRQWPSPEDRVDLLDLAADNAAVAEASLVDFTYALRQAVSQAARPYVDVTPSAKLARTMGKVVLSRWAVDDPYLIAAHLDVGEAPSGGGATGAVTAILQMLAFDLVTAGMGRLRDELHRRQLSKTSLVVVTNGRRLGMKGLTKLEKDAIALITGGELDGASNHRNAEAIRFMAKEKLRPTDAPEASELIREIDAAMKPALIDKYLELRFDVESNGRPLDPLLDEVRPAGTVSPQEAADMLYALADQGIRLEAVHLSDRRLVDRFDQMMSEMSGVRGLAHMGARDDGLLQSKLGDQHGGILRMLEALTAASSAGTTGEKHRDIERLEQIQQIRLSICGVYTTLVEDHLAKTMGSRDAHRGVVGLVRAALAHSRESLTTLGHIRTAMGGQLQPRRESDRRHIASVAWIETVYKNRLRAMIAARTALKAGLLGKWDAPEEMEEIAILQIHHAYMAIVGLPKIADRKALGMQGTWLAMLGKGSVPFHPRASVSLASLAFLDDDPERPPTSSLVEIDIEHSVVWHRELGDRGSLGRILPGSLAWRALQDASDGRFSKWLDGICDLPERPA